MTTLQRREDELRENEAKEELDELCSCKQRKGEEIYDHYHALRKIETYKKWSDLDNSEKLLWIRLVHKKAKAKPNKGKSSMS